MFISTAIKSSLFILSSPVLMSYRRLLTTFAAPLAAAALFVALPLQQASAQSTILSVTSNENPAAYGDVLTFTAFINTNYPNGTVTFYDGSSVLATVPVQSNGVATFSISQLSVGTHSISATYSGDYLNASLRSGYLTQSVTAGNSNYYYGNYSSGNYYNRNYYNGNYYNNGSYNYPYYNTQTSVSITSSTNPAWNGDVVTFTARVSGGVNPTGTVTFLDNGANIGTVILVGNGVAPFSTSQLAVGTHSIVARYNGDGRNATSYSPTIAETINARVYYNNYNNYYYNNGYNYSRPMPVFQLPPYPYPYYSSQPTYRAPWRPTYFQQSNYSSYRPRPQTPRPPWWR